VPIGPIRALLTERRNAATATIGAAVEEPWQQQREVLDRFPPKTEGVLIRVLKKDGPAARAGLKQWDLIVAAEGQEVRLSSELLRIVRGKQPGQSLKLTVLGPDGTGSREVEVPLGKLEVGWPETADDE
jgi:S1-C subfamily serine protease